MLLLTSLYEPFGLVLPEAMSCGLPVVAFDCPYGPADIITDGVDGFLIKDRDIEAFADRVCQLIESEELRCQMGKQGVVSSQRYRADRIMPMWNRLFQELAAHASSPKE
jgi:glycosyltransferase involved in cell wall biosynthesis